MRDEQQIAHYMEASNRTMRGLLDRIEALERDSHPPTAHPTLRLLDIVEDLLDCLDSEQGCFASTNVRDRLTTLRHELEKD